MFKRLKRCVNTGNTGRKSCACEKDKNVYFKTKDYDVLSLQEQKHKKKK